VPGGLLGYLKQRALNMDRIQKSISPNQSTKIRESYEKNASAVSESGTMRATMQDFKLFGRI
jgi:hypothetical protein